MRVLNLLLVCGVCGIGGISLRAEDLPPDLSQQVDALLTGDPDAVPFLLKHRESALRLLGERVEGKAAPLEELLMQLGAEDYHVRERASLALMRMGKAIHPDVKAHRAAMIADPEVVFRCDRILAAEPSDEKASNDVAVILFLLALPDPTRDELLPFAHLYLRVFESKNKEMFHKAKDAKTPTLLLPFLRQWTKLPGGTEAIVAWVQRERPLEEFMAAARVLLENDFQGAMPQFPPNRNSLGLLLLLMEEDFHKQLDEAQREEVFIGRSKILHNVGVRNQLLSRVDSPESAWTAMRLLLPYQLDPKQFDALFRHLEKLLTGDFLELARTEPAPAYLVEALARNREDAVPDLRKILLEQLFTTDSLWHHERYFFLLRDKLGHVFHKGDLDASWQRHIERKEGKIGRFYSNVKAMDISPALVMQALRTYPASYADPLSGYILYNPLLHILQAGETEHRKEILEWIVQNCGGIRFSPQEIKPIRSQVLMTFAEPDDSLAFLQLHAFCVLSTPKINEPAFNLLSYIFPNEVRPVLADYFSKNEKAVMKFLADEEKVDLHLALLFPLVLENAFNAKHGPQFTECLKRIWSQLPKEDERRRAALVASLLLDLADPDFDAALLDMLQEPPDKKWPMDLIHVLDRRQSRLLPELLKRSESADAQGRRLFQAAMAIDADHPELRKRQEHILAGKAPPEDLTALLEVLFSLAREPNLSEFSPDDLRLSFPTDTPEALEHTLQRLAFFREPANRRTLLRLLRPDVPTLLAGDGNLEPFQMLYKHPFPDREEDVFALARLLRPEMAAIRSTVAETLCFMDVLPDAMADILQEALRQNEGNGQHSLLWAMALTGRTLPDASAQFEAQRGRLKMPQSREAFFLANTHPSPQERERNLRRLMDEFLKEPEWWKIKQIRLTRGFPDIVQPFLEDILRRGLYSDAKEDDRIYSGHVSQIFQWIPEAFSGEEARARFKRILQDAAAPQSHLRFSQSTTDSILRVLEVYYPEHVVEFGPLLEKLPFHCRSTAEFRRFLSRIVRCRDMGKN